VVFCTINRLDTSQTAGQRQVQVSRQTGTKQVYNEKKKTNETEPVYSMVNETQTFTTVRGDIAVAIQVRDRKTGATIDSQTLSPTYNTEIPAGTTPPDKNQVEQWLIDRAVLQEVQRLTPTREPIKVLLARPNDQIDDLNGLAKAGLWSRMLEQLELTKPLPDPKKEAYRLYNIGLANEALAYGTDDLDTSRKLLEQASALYGKALEMKPDEKYFREPQTRIADGITAYAELDRQRTLIAAAAAKAQAAPTPVEAEGSRSLSGPASEPGVLTNRDVIELVKTGIDEANLNATIREAKRVSFDLSPAGLKQLLTEKVSNSIIALMRAKQNGAPKATSAKRKP
jgi:hypothetical protein